MRHYFIDIDETLFHTKAKIHIIKDNKILKKLTNQEFNTYQLANGEKFDFIEFASSEIFVKTSTPNQKMIDIVEQIHRETPNIALLTAREDFDDKYSLLEYMQSHNLKVGHYRDNEIHIIRSGNISSETCSTSQAKIKMIDNIVKKNPLIREIVLYDDCTKNLDAVKRYTKEVGLMSVTYKVTDGEITKY